MTHPAHGAATLAEIWRGPFLESAHQGHAVVCDDTGQIVEAWGTPDTLVLPRSSSKMIQALPLIESGAAHAHNLTPEHLALACASHQGAPIHIDKVGAWLNAIGKGDDDFRCGPQESRDPDLRDAMIRANETPCRIHNNCSGKHTGFLTLAKHLGAGPDYVDPDHPVQRACLDAFERTTNETSPGFGIDGCSAPNFACTLNGMARAMAHFASADADSAEGHLRHAMAAHPDLVAGEGRACTRLMRAGGGKIALKTGAEGFFIAILPEQRMGVALKITDGATRAAECAIAQILVRLGALDPNHPEALAYTASPIKNWDGLETGHMRAAPALL
ncbi:asparaginase [Tateyamaria omphalii]|uniref:L-asparaginase n=1 Tax=Tateyamaria omphalii TaxID=299262 RepID=A0A1P8MYA7_9RHOB|nr:asparaginase [Tateyamaria omphalii]APX13054.1 L-asparaginase [Tateyamaria omphalii]